LYSGYSGRAPSRRNCDKSFHTTAERAVFVFVFAFAFEVVFVPALALVVVSGSSLFLGVVVDAPLVSVPGAVGTVLLFVVLAAAVLSLVLFPFPFPFPIVVVVVVVTIIVVATDLLAAALLLLPP